MEKEISQPVQNLGRGPAALLLVLLCALAWVLQAKNGVFISDIGADPDEPAHAVTSLMVRDYLLHGLPHAEHPLRYAQNYYDHLPKVALGHYPPLFYALTGVWMLPLASKAWLMILMTLLAGTLGWFTTQIALRCGLKRNVAVLAGVGFVLLPITQKQAMLVMSDTLLAFGLLGSAWAFARFMEVPNVKRSLLFGTLAAATILVKGSGAALALVPPLMIIALRRWSLLLNWRLWLAPVPVLLTAMPWTLATMHITQEGMAGIPVREYFQQALVFYARAVGWSFGPVLLLAAGAGLVMALRRGLQPLPVALGALTLALLFLYHVSPTGLSARYLLPLAPVVLVAVGCSVNRLPFAGWIMAALLAVALVLLGPVPRKHTAGYTAMATALLDRGASGRVLISSDARGEGGLIAALAFQMPDRASLPWTVLRASKFAASSDWSGRGYTLRFSDPAAFNTGLQDAAVDWVVLDTGVPKPYREPHHDLIEAWAAQRKTVSAAPVLRHDDAEGGTLNLVHAK